jgi:hypothetical protein
VGLAATATDSGSGVAAVVFQLRSAGSSGAWTDLATDTSSPFTGTLNATTLPSGDYDIRILAADALGNTSTSGAVRVTIDSAAPAIAFNSLAPVLSGSTLLRTTITGSGADHVVFARRSGTSPWLDIDTDASAPFTAVFDTSEVPDGPIDLRATVVDGFGNSSEVVASGVGIDNTAPRLVSSSPADGSTIASASSIALTATETLASVDTPRLDGSPTPAPTLSGATAAFATGALADGPHTLEGWLSDDAGQSRRFRVDFTIYVASSASADAPPVSKSTDSTTTTVLTSVDSTSTVTMPAGAYAPPASNPSDWLVVTIDPTPSGSLPTAALAPGAVIVDVVARWAIGGSVQHDFNAPIEILLSNTTGSLVVPATLQAGQWRPLPALPGSDTTLPGGWSDGFYRASDGIHLLTRHLTLFSLLRDFEPPTPPRDFAAEVAADGVTLRWLKGTDDASGVAGYTLYVNGSAFAAFDAEQYETKLGQILPGDTREFSLSEHDGVGNESARTTAFVVLPELVGRTADEGRDALGARGLTVGTITERASSAPAGTILEPAGVGLRLKGTAVDLVVAAGGGPQTKLSFSVSGTTRIAASARTVSARLKLTKSATVVAALHGPKKLKLYTWNLKAKAGASTVKLRIPDGVVRKPGTFTIVWIARSGQQFVRTTQRVTVTRPRNSARHTTG